jgi:hypothetical protein
MYYILISIANGFCSQCDSISPISRDSLRLSLFCLGSLVGICLLPFQQSVCLFPNQHVFFLIYAYCHSLNFFLLQPFLHHRIIDWQLQKPGRNKIRSYLRLGTLKLLFHAWRLVTLLSSVLPPFSSFFIHLGQCLLLFVHTLFFFFFISCCCLPFTCVFALCVLLWLPPLVFLYSLVLHP